MCHGVGLSYRDVLIHVLYDVATDGPLGDIINHIFVLSPGSDLIQTRLGVLSR